MKLPDYQQENGFVWNQVLRNDGSWFIEWRYVQNDGRVLYLNYTFGLSRRHAVARSLLPPPNGDWYSVAELQADLDDV